jgi:formamidopyrimidine-DNA glycosylase
MPEIGECYTIANQIPSIEKVENLEKSSKFFKYINLNKNCKTIFSAQKLIINKPFAYGKSIWFPIEVDNQKGFLVSQLGMTGSWFLDNCGRPNKNDHLTFFYKNHKLRYSDPRMFGKMQCFLVEEGKNIEDLKKEIIKKYKWGIDPFIASIEDLTSQLKRWQKSSKNIKTLMLDQNIVFGIGNYLASEILFASKISPYKLGKQLTQSDLKVLAKNIKKIVEIAIKTGGFSFAAGYYHPDGSVGQMAKHIKVYEKLGQSCPECSANIKKDFINGRATYFCQKCQKK